MMHSVSNENFFNNLQSEIDTYSSLSYNYLFAFNDGNIGYLLASGLPNRNNTEIIYQGTHAFDGTNSENDWTSIKALSDLPFGSNPNKGYFISTNNRAVPEIYYNDIGAASVPGHNHRAKRLDDLMKKNKDYKKLSFDKMREF
mmetsp:Transcript_38606/g.52440  ORF Transcript_38606/g.52440 Transcript_38606/m.52440 type:complete len:143 (+) Transcript_38606:1353-1781(+)